MYAHNRTMLSNVLRLLEQKPHHHFINREIGVTKETNTYFVIQHPCDAKAVLS